MSRPGNTQSVFWRRADIKTLQRRSTPTMRRSPTSYAIIPTGQLSELRSLHDLQRRVYDLIVRRFLSIFYPPAEYRTVKLVVDMDGEKLFASAKELKEPGVP